MVYYQLNKKMSVGKKNNIIRHIEIYTYVFALTDRHSCLWKKNEGRKRINENDFVVDKI